MTTKADLLAGVRRRDTVPIDALDGAEVVIRPLRASEEAEAEALAGGGIVIDVDPGDLITSDDMSVQDLATKARGKVALDVSELVRGDSVASLFVARCGLSVDEEWADDEVDELGPDAVKEIARAVLALTSKARRRDAARFRGDG